MKIIKPLTFDASMLLSSNAVEAHPAWLIGTTYAKDDLVDYGTYIYISLVNSNVGNQPDTSPTKWLLVSPDNTHAMFDEQVNTITTSSTPLEVSVEPGEIFNSLALINIRDATSVTIEVTDGVAGPVVYDQTIDLDDTVIVDWYLYFFEPFNFKTDLVITDIPPYSSGVINMTLSAGAGTVGLGNFVFGNLYELGLTQMGANIGIRDYSVKQTDEFGNTTFVARAFSKRMDVSVYVKNTDIRLVSKVLGDIRATPCVYIASEAEDYSPLIVYGFYRDYNIDIAYPSHSIMRVEVEGLI